MEAKVKDYRIICSQIYFNSEFIIDKITETFILDYKGFAREYEVIIELEEGLFLNVDIDVNYNIHGEPYAKISKVECVDDEGIHYTEMIRLNDIIIIEEILTRTIKTLA